MAPTGFISDEEMSQLEAEGKASNPPGFISDEEMANMENSDSLSSSNVLTQPEDAKSYLIHKLGSGLSAAGELATQDAPNFIKGAADIFEKGLQRPSGGGVFDPAINIAQEGLSRLTPASAIRMGGTTLGAISPMPITGATAGDYLAGKLNQYLGFEPEAQKDQEFKQAVKDVLTMGGAKGLGRLTGPSNKTMALEEAAANRPSYATDVQNANKGTTDAAQVRSQEFADHAPTLTKNADELIGKLNPKDPEAWQQYRINLDKMKAKAIEMKDKVIKSGVAAERKSGKGMTRDYVDLSHVEKKLAEEPRTDFAYETKKLVQKRFDNVKKFLEPTPERGTPGQPPSIKAVQQYVGQLDKEISSLQGYDQAQKTISYKNPSNYDADLAALKQIRHAVNDGLIKYTKDLLGENASTVLEDANSKIAAGIDLGELAKQFETETGQTFGPGSGKALVKPGSTQISTGFWRSVGNVAKNILTPGADRQAILQAGVTREGAALRQMKLAADVQRGMMTSNRLSRQVRDAFTGASGVAEASQAPPLIPRDPDAVSQNPQAQQALLASVPPQVAGILQAAFEKGDPQSIQAGLTLAMQAAPNLFERSKTGLLSEMRRGNDLIIGNPQEADMYKQTVSNFYGSKMIDANQYAAQISALNDPTDRRILVTAQGPINPTQPLKPKTFEIPKTIPTVAGEMNSPPY